MKNVTQFISMFTSAVSNCLLYSIDHSSVDGLIEKAFAVLKEMLEESGVFEMMIIENDLVINKNPVREVGLQGHNLMRRLKRKGVSHIHFSGNVTRGELRNLVSDIASTERGLKSSANIIVGTVDVRIGGFQGVPGVEFLRNGAADIQKSMAAFTPAQIEKARKEYSTISPFRKLHLAGFEELVGHFVLTLRKEMNVLKLLRPTFSRDCNDETHATNVAVLAVFQAQAIGIKEEFHGDIGLAALLHDVGKACIPEEILEKEPSPSARERAIAELHPLYGAQYLATMKGLTPLAPIVAFEHHLRYDGRGSPNPEMNSAKQHICSQIVAIADAFDKLRIATPGRRALDLKQTLITMKTKDEGLFNPFLIDNFIRSIHLALSG